MNGKQQWQRIVLGVFSAAMAFLLVFSSVRDASAVDKTRYPGYQGPDLAATCDALDDWEIDTGGYLECGPGADENSDECNAQNIEGCVFDPLPVGPVVDNRGNGQLASFTARAITASSDDDATGASVDDSRHDQTASAEKNKDSKGATKAKGKGKGKGKGKSKGGRGR